MAGCKTHELPENWRPLTTLVERGDLPGVGDGVVTTISPRLYVKDLDQFEEDYPEGSPYREALRRHELQHAKEQEAFIDGATGIKRKIRMSMWLKKYLTDKSFRWEVEKRGYRESILYLKSRNIGYRVEALAKVLSGKTYGKMVSYEEALDWIKKVYAGQA